LEYLYPVTNAHYLLLSALLFAVGTAGVLARRNLFISLMALELMLNAVNLTLAAYSRANGDETGQVLALFVVAVAAAEACVGLALVIALYRLKDTVDLDLFRSLKG
jgi:NADH-quinone oxidoreductase subunit K